MPDSLTTLLGNGSLFQGGAALMIMGWLGYQLRSLPGRLITLARTCATRVIEVRETHPHYHAWLQMLTQNAIRRGGPRTLEARWIRRDDDGDVPAGTALVAGHDRFICRIQRRWYVVRIGVDTAHASRPHMQPTHVIRVEAILASAADIARLARLAEDLADINLRRQIVRTHDRHGCGSEITLPKRDPRTLCLPDGMFELLETQLRDFIAARSQYERAGIPWRIGVLLAGEPGTGKTSLAHAIASSLGLPIVAIILADIENDHELSQRFQSIAGQAVVLIEDIDCAFCQRNGEEARGVSFSGLLNAIDGVLAPHNGRILVMSTNHPERLDPALVRPGRADIRIEVPLLDWQSATNYVDRLFPHVPTRHDVVREVMTAPRPTPAMLINRIMRERWHRPTLSAPPRSSARAAKPQGTRHDHH